LRRLQHPARVAASVAIIALTSTFGAAPVPVLGADKAPVNVGLIFSSTGLLASYGAQYEAGFKIGLAYATHGTGAVNGHKINVTEMDDAGTAATAVTEAKGLIGQGYKIIAGSTSSAVALTLAPLAKENQVLFISGPAAADAVTGNNRFTFRSGRQTFQDVATAAQVIGELQGKKILVFAQDSAFGKANVGAVQATLGRADVSSLLVPLTANDFTPFAQKAKDAHPDLIFIAWAGATAGAMWKALDDQGVLAQTKIVTGLDQRASYPVFAPVAGKLTFLSHYFYQAPAKNNAANNYLTAALKKTGKVPDLFDPDGFVAAQMIVHAVQVADGDDPAKTVPALEGWTFGAPKGGQTIRAADHAMLQPMFICRLVGSGANVEPHLVRTLEPNAVAPPVHAFP
jgi:branched-chain amino acid transport system substrate-binding protein